jgi:hypothetical protein
MAAMRHSKLRPGWKLPLRYSWKSNFVREAHTIGWLGLSTVREPQTHHSRGSTRFFILSVLSVVTAVADSIHGSSTYQAPRSLCLVGVSHVEAEPMGKLFWCVP